MISDFFHRTHKLLRGRAVFGKRALKKTGPCGDGPRTAEPSFVCENLEPRLLLSSSSGMPIGEVIGPFTGDSVLASRDLGVIAQSVDPSQALDQAPKDIVESSHLSLRVSSETSRAQTDPQADFPARASDCSLCRNQQAVLRRELVFVDPDVQDYQQLLDNLRARAPDGHPRDVVLLASNRNGIEQVSEVLARSHQLDAIEVITHGTDGAVKLGNVWLRAENLAGYAGSIAGWRAALADNADILFYGCDVAAGAAGRALVEGIGRLTGADVAASVDRTGDPAHGGNWTLEVATGAIEYERAPDVQVRAPWSRTLGTYAVANINDSGPGSLRQAILDANANAGLDTITFNIAGGGIHTIAPISALPDITDAVIIDATSQPGYAGTPLIELDGTGAGNNRAGLTLESGSSGSTIRGLAINRFGGDGIHITRSSGNLIEHNFIGTDPSGTIARGNGGDGIELYFSAANNVIRYNVISANVWGISIGIGSSDDDSNVIQANKVGTDVTGTIALGNTTAGITAGFGCVNTLIGGSAAGQANVIAFNGIGLEFRPNAAAGHSILGNSIFANGSLGIDLGSDGVTANDAGDGDAGPNNRQNFPVLTSAQAVSSTQVTIVGAFNSTANSYFRVEFFAGTTADGSGYGQGQRYLGFANVATDGSGNAAINATLTAAVAPGELITATATRSDDTFSTFTDSSEFAQNVMASGHAPVLDPARSPVLTAANQDAGAPAGAVGTPVSSLVDFAVPAGQVDNVTDVDSGALLGIAVTAADTSNGTWYYSTDGGTTWNALGAVADNNARLLAADANTRLYLQPNANYHGTLAAALTFRAWDQTGGSNGALADTTINGGTTAFSTATDTASLTVNPVAHTPSVIDATTDEDTQTTSGLVISRNAADGAEVTHFKITGITGGTLYQNDGTTPIAESSFITFAEGNAGLKFTPTANFSGSGYFMIQASTSNGDAGLGGGTVNATITVNAVNDAPVIDDQSFSVDENAANGTSVGTVAASDVDAGDSLTYSITAGNTGGAFAMDANTGEMTVASRAALDFETNPTFRLTVRVEDTGNLTDTATVTINLNNVNEAPLLLVPGELFTQVAVPIVFRSADGTGISVRDVDAGAGPIQMDIHVAHGDVTLAGIVGLTFLLGDGVEDAIVRFTGTQAAVNAALEGMVFKPQPGHVGQATVQLAVDDQGYSGSGGQLLDVRVVSILVSAVPPPADSPVVPAPLSPGRPEPGLSALDIPAPEISQPDPEDPREDASEGTASQVPTDAPAVAGATIVVNIPRPRGTRGSATLARKPVSTEGSPKETRPDDSPTPPVDGTTRREHVTEPEERVQDRTDVGTASAALAESVHANAVMWSQVESMKGRMDQAARIQERENAIAVGVATGMSVSFAAGYVIWLLRGGALLASILAATPLWKSFDPLPVLAFWEKRKKQRRRPGGKDRSSADDEHELDELFGSSDGATPDGSWRVTE